MRDLKKELCATCNIGSTIPTQWHTFHIWTQLL